jgi:hypothetical protein
MGNSWRDLTNDPLESGPGTGTAPPDDGATRERDSEKWRMPAGTADLVNFAEMMKAPEDLRMLPQDLQLLPQEANADENTWVAADLDPESTAFYWTPIADPVDG